jgi:hypothetical protein
MVMRSELRLPLEEAAVAGDAALVSADRLAAQVCV